MAKRRMLSKRSSRKVFRKGTKTHRKNGLSSGPVYRGGIRL